MCSQIEELENKYQYLDEFSTPNKIWVCHCEQCRYVKNKRKNRKFKKKIRRLLNKRRRREDGVGVIHYWA